MASNELIKALLEVQKTLPAAEKNKTGQQGRGVFTYANIESILEVLIPTLNNNNLILSQDVISIEGKVCLVTTLSHTSGETKSSTLEINHMGGNIKEFGGSITYYRRYALQSMFCILCVDEKDKDEGDTDPENMDKDIKKTVAPKEIKKLSPDQIGEINELIPDELWDWLKEFLLSKGYKNLAEVEASKFNPLIKMIKDKKELVSVLKQEATNEK